MKIAIVGAGAVGGLLAGWLGSRTPEAQRPQLSMLARGATLQALQRDGLVLETADAPALAVPVLASDDPQALGVQDLVVLAVKGPSLQQVAPAVQALCGPHTDVLVAMNGLPWWFFDDLAGFCKGLRLQAADPGEVARRHIPTASVIGCVVHFSGSAPRPGVARHGGGNGLILGEPAGGASARVQRLVELFGAAGLAASASDCIQRDIWFKLWGNMSMNPVSALTGATGDRILDDELVREFLSAVMREARGIGASFGIPIEQDPEERHAVTRRLGAFRTSMLQDAEAGRPLELDALLGTVREVAQHMRLPTPHLDALLGLTRLMARTRGLAPPAPTA